MKKRIAVTLLLVILLIICAIPTSASTFSQIRASKYLNSYFAMLDQGTTAGNLSLSFSVVATGKMNLVGISRINVYKANGTFVETITGTVANGLLGASDMHHSGNYTYHGTPGTSYYFAVTVYAGDSTGSDSRTVTTNTVKAPA